MEKRYPRGLRKAIIATLAILTVEGLTGDFVNLFSTVSSGAVSYSMGGLLQALTSAGAAAVYHAFEGALLTVLSLAVLALSFRSNDRKVRLTSILASAAMISAAVGGSLFVLSGFQDNGDSAQMGGGFIGAYAFNFLLLYFTKPPQYAGDLKQIV